MNQDDFLVTYQIISDEAEAFARAKMICLEQTVEVSEELIESDFIREQIIGQLIEFKIITSECFHAVIRYTVDTTAFELTQLLNVIFGNTSIKAQIKIINIQLPTVLLTHFSGPRFGIAGLRKIIQVAHQPLLCTALKPMGKSATELATLAYQFALGGVDIIKDDHGLTNQAFCPYEERVKACITAVAKANDKTGKNCIYVPNITAPVTEIEKRVIYAKRQGAGGLLIAPGLTGFDTMRAIAESELIDLPLISHPALLGSMVISQTNGFAHSVLFATLQRLAGADATIYPNYGGRFGFSREECNAIATACGAPLGNYPAIFPTPGGGMTLDKVPDMQQLYGEDVIFLIGGALYAHSPDLVENVRYFLNLVGRNLGE